MPEAQKYDREFHHKVTIHYEVAEPANTQSFPTARDRSNDTLRKLMLKVLREELTKGGPA